jgi:hypothetical protein
LSVLLILAVGLLFYTSSTAAMSTGHQTIRSDHTKTAKPTKIAKPTKTPSQPKRRVSASTTTVTMMMTVDA